ncbi:MULTISPECIES: ATP-binding protein [unclassified Pseudoalteromonas]|uniref:ATP-binding protein n=1 Tax=unclassified Pseudoalteromonas TaxID=194690 RepID=UPI002096F0F3|nr:ATP-binding protein [Pseudoalteromonas sp. XMcav2-N]MCO7188764.1 ATP-binding protein [Pseudoalteromonas sp. XMcav2-N]
MRKYLLVKIFLWFWGTIAATLFMLMSISLLQPDILETRQISPAMMKNMHHLKRSIERRAQSRPGQELNTLLPGRHRNHGPKIYLRHSDEQLSVLSHAALQEWDLSLLNFTTSSQPQVVDTERYRAYGPLDIQLHGETYQLFQLMDHRDPHILTKIRMLPNWAKLLVLILASFAFSLWFARGLLKPVRQLQQAAASLAQGKLDARAGINFSRQDELGQLGKDFDQMASRLQAHVTQQKRLLADISHELRSPLTRLQMANGIASDKAPAPLIPYLQRVEKEAHLLEHMLSDILQLSRLESQQLVLTPHPISLTELLEPILDDAKFEGQQLGKQIEWQPLPDITLTVDAALLNRAFENILRNAIKYANKQVSLTIQRSDDQLTVTISDDGPGVSDTMLEKLCIPFFRASQARTPDGAAEPGGFGLGLAIAQHAVKVHHGHIQFSNHSGLRVTVTLPTGNHVL